MPRKLAHLFACLPQSHSVCCVKENNMKTIFPEAALDLATLAAASAFISIFIWHGLRPEPRDR